MEDGLSLVSFQSTLPIQGETDLNLSVILLGVISIHSPYTGRDKHLTVDGNNRIEFQSTLPIQGETNPLYYHLPERTFQSTLPIQGETCGQCCNTEFRRYFNPLSLYRERHKRRSVIRMSDIFQSTLPIQGETIGLY